MSKIALETLNKRNQTVARPSYLKGNVVMLESFENALRFLSNYQEETFLNYDFKEKSEKNDNDLISVMIVLSVQNYNSFKYYRVNRAKYSAYPNEKEIILPDATKVFIIGAGQVTLDCKDQRFNDLASSKLFLLHMFAAG